MPMVHGSGAGYGTSMYEPLPFYQNGVNDPQNITATRITPDVSDVATTLTEYDRNGWVYGGGTSAAAPQWAALIALADQARKESPHHLAPFVTEASDSLQTQLQEALYFSPATDFYMNGDSPNRPAYQAYSPTTGLGTPNAANLINYLATWSLKPAFTMTPTTTASDATISLDVGIDNQAGILLNNLGQRIIKLSIAKSTGHVALSGQMIATVTDGVATFNSLILKGRGTCTLRAEFDSLTAESSTIIVTPKVDAARIGSS
jgi:subtilase family serine protease